MGRTRDELIAELRSSHLHMYDGSRDGHGMKVFLLCTEAADAIIRLEREVKTEHALFLIEAEKHSEWLENYMRMKGRAEKAEAALRGAQP